jgi:hypothetical protein
MIEKGTGRAPVSFAYPFCKSNPTVRERVMRRHVGARGYHPLYEGSYPADKALADGGWRIYLSHGISPDALKAHLDDIAPLRPRLWIAPYGAVAAYCAARDRARLTVTANEKGRCTFTLALPDDAPAALKGVRLTVVIPAQGVTAETKVACEPSNATAEPGSDRIAVTAFPSGGSVTVTWRVP